MNAARNFVTSGTAGAYTFSGNNESKACLVLSGAASKELLDLTRAHRKKNPGDKLTLSLVDHQDYSARDGKTGDTLLCWKKVRWNRNFTEIAFLESFLGKLSAGEYLFIRLGDKVPDVRGARWDSAFTMWVEPGIVIQQTAETGRTRSLKL